MFLLCLYHGAQVYAWEDSFMAKLFGVREQEMNFVIKSSYLKAVYNTILVRQRVCSQSNCRPSSSALIHIFALFFFRLLQMVCPTLMSVVSFITLGAASPSQLTAQNVFSSLVYFNLLRTPLMVLPMVRGNLLITVPRLSSSDNSRESCHIDLSFVYELAPNFAQTLGMFFESKVAVARITAFLLAPELDSQPERLAACDAAAGNQQDQECAIEITNASFRWEAVASQSNRAEAASVAGPSIGTASGGALAGASWHANPLASTGTTDASARADVLSNVSLSLPRGVLCAVIGAVGSGKSTLLSGLLGELKRSAGAVRLRGRVGFCPQQAWIQNASLRDNVLFGAAFDRRRYDRAIEQCALTRDLDVLLVW